MKRLREGGRQTSKAESQRAVSGASPVSKRNTRRSNNGQGRCSEHKQRERRKSINQSVQRQPRRTGLSGVPSGTQNGDAKFASGYLAIGPLLCGVTSVHSDPAGLGRDPIAREPPSIRDVVGILELHT